MALVLLKYHASVFGLKSYMSTASRPSLGYFYPGVLDVQFDFKDKELKDTYSFLVIWRIVEDLLV